MEDSNIRQILFHYFDGSASIDEEKIIREWLTVSPDNESILLKERRLYDLSLMNGVSDKNIYHKKQLFTWNVLLKIAAVAVILLVLTFIYNEYKRPQGPQYYQTIYVPAGQRINITLPDNTNVWLNAGTTLRYPIAFNDKERRVVLDGEAYFDVSKDANKRFVIETKEYDVNVLGTKFNVEAYSEKGYFETMLVDGKVNISLNNDSKKEYNIVPGQKFSSINGKAFISTVDDLGKYRWKEGLICLKNESFPNIIREFEKYYNTKIIIGNTNYNNHLYTGKFRQADGIEYALHVLQKEILFKYTRKETNAGEIVIYIK